MNKRRTQAVSILAVLFLAFSVCIFAIPFPKGSTFWCGYVAVFVAVLAQVPIFKLAYDNQDSLKSKVLGFPVFRVGYSYLLIQTVVSVILFVLSSFIETFPTWISLVLCVGIAAGAYVCSITVDIVRDEVLSAERENVLNTEFIKGARIKVHRLTIQVDDETLKKALLDFEEHLKYSDPVSNEKIREQEMQLETVISELEKAVVMGDAVLVGQLCKNAKILLDERNAVCKMSKTEM